VTRTISPGRVGLEVGAVETAGADAGDVLVRPGPGKLVAGGDLRASLDRLSHGRYNRERLRSRGLS
jgi:hypothetical protein